MSTGPVDRLIANPAAFEHGAEADGQFLAAMQDNFRRHYRECHAYSVYCDLAGIQPRQIRTYPDVFRIPYIFVTNFKRRKLVTGDEGRIKLVLTSSGTAGEKSAIYLDARSLSRITRIVHNIYAALGMVDYETATNYLAFTYDPRVAKDLGTAFSDKLLTGLTKVGLVHYAIVFDRKRQAFELDRARCWKALERFAREDRPLRILGFPALIWEVLEEYCEREGRRFRFGPSSYLITGGGWKNKADQEIPKQHFREKVGEWLGIPPSNVRDLYGMVEHGVPYCECEHGEMHVPIYSRVAVRDPATLRILDWGETGVFHMLTPYLNSFPALSLLTSDVGRLHPTCRCGRNAPRLEIVGRGGVTRQKGCAIAALDVLEQPIGAEG
jgi:phenylacetate-coenzyme A ligase PaaK-like adenylate-forming protein